MAYSFHWIPARQPEAAQEGLNAVLRGRAVVGVEKHFNAGPDDPGWAVCVEYAESRGSSGGEGVAPRRVDYREVLSPEDFTVFSALRKVRKEIASEEGVPIYAVLGNEQLAEVARRRCRTANELEAIAGIGEAKARKYGPRMLEAVAACGAPPSTGSAPNRSP